MTVEEVLREYVENRDTLRAKIEEHQASILSTEQQLLKDARLCYARVKEGLQFVIELGVEPDLAKYKTFDSVVDSMVTNARKLGHEAAVVQPGEVE